MLLYWLTLLCVTARASLAIDPGRHMIGGRACGLTYGRAIEWANEWVCHDPQYQQYPRAEIEQLKLGNVELSEYLDITAGCHAYHDADVYGKNEYYNYESVCKSNRRPVNVIWSEVPGVKLDPALQALNHGRLPCHVVDGQALFDLECTHPWADGLPKSMAPRRRRRLRRLRFPGAKRHFCLLGYMYNPRYMCRPAGYATRTILVYSKHVHKFFFVAINSIPTSCSCSSCSCNMRG